ncbi:MAG TPA: ABC transporter permease [Gemmatimonadaceae bacterium]|nr:ABC transporter permease [Gemmatimonadaceae bacterium]
MRVLPSRDELTHAVRALRRSPGFTTVAILSLGIAIALAVTMVGVLDALIDPQFPFKNQQDLYTVSWEAPARARAAVDGARHAPLADELRQSVASITEVSRTGNGLGASSSAGDDDVQAPNATAMAAGDRWVALNFFEVLGVHPMLGRLFTSRDSSASADHLAIISPELWRRLYPGRTTFAPFSAFVGSQAFTVIGVLPDRVRQAFPEDIWIAEPPDVRWSTLLVRARRGVSQTDLLRSLDPLNAERALELQRQPSESRFHVDPVAVSQIRDTALAAGLAAAAIAVLLIACANVSNLQLARGMVRVRDLAVRAALGASRGDVVRLLLTESALIALGGGLVAGVLSVWGASAVRAVIPPSVALLGFVSPQMSWHVFAAGLLLTAGTAAACGLAPALRVSRANVNDVLQSRAGTGTTARTRHVYATLVVVEIAGAVALVVGAGLMGGSARNLHDLDFGFTPHRVIEAGLSVRVADDAGRAQAMASVLDAARELPAVQHAAFAQYAWFYHDSIVTDDPTVHHPEGVRSGTFDVLRLVTADYLRTLGVGMVAGSDFQPGDDGTVPQAIVDSVAARTYWPGVNPVGHMLKIGSRAAPRPWVRVVGVARHVRYSIDRSLLADAVVPEFYVLDRNFWSEVSPPPYRNLALAGALMVRGPGGDPRALEGRLNELARARAGRNGGGARLMDEATGRVELEESQDFLASLFVAFGLLGLALAMIGVYGVVAHAVAQRTREFGVRIALGAQTVDVVMLVLGEGNLAILGGIALGLLGASLGDKLLSAFVVAFDGPAELVVYVAAPLAIATAAAAATFTPALRAARIDPVEALRSE